MFLFLLYRVIGILDLKQIFNYKNFIYILNIYLLFLYKHQL